MSEQLSPFDELILDILKEDGESTILDITSRAQRFVASDVPTADDITLCLENFIRDGKVTKRFAKTQYFYRVAK